MAKILINKNNLFYNLDVISKQTGSIDKVAIVLKDNAYGHGLLEIASLAKEFGIKKAVAKNVKDALKIEKYFDYILILTETTFENYSHNFHIALNSFDDIVKLPTNCNVHIKIDTGMHRNGIQIEKLEDAFLGLSKKNIKITGIFTHHKAADEITNDFYLQNNKFLEAKNLTKIICEKLSLPLPAFHSCNSSALFRTPNFNEDFARVGIATYGYLNNEDFPEFPILKPVLSLWGKKISTRILNKDETVGYGGKFKATNDMKISTYDVGYGDGFLRLNERKSYTTPKGYKVLGRVSMDYLSLNTNEDEVCIFDNAIQLAKVHDTITYEIVTTLSADVERQII